MILGFFEDFAIRDIIHNSELGTFEWWISGLMLDPLFFLISRWNNARVLLFLLITRLINGSGLKTSHSKVFSSEYISLEAAHILFSKLLILNLQSFVKTVPGHLGFLSFLTIMINCTLTKKN